MEPGTKLALLGGKTAKLVTLLVRLCVVEWPGLQSDIGFSCIMQQVHSPTFSEHNC